MDWLLCIAIAVLANSAGIFVDNYISDYYFKGRGAASQKTFFRLIYIITGIICVIAGGVNFGSIPPYIYLIFILSGIGAATAGIFYYKALELTDSTDFGIFAQLSPIFYLLFGWLFLNQTIDIYQLIAFSIIIIAPFLIIMAAKKRSRGLRIKAALYVILNVSIVAFCSIFFVKYHTSELNFVTEIGFLLVGKGIGNAIIILLNPKWKKRYKFVLKSSGKRIYYPFIGTFTLSIINEFAKNLAFVLAPSVALVSAINDSARPIVIFFMGLLFTLLWPKFGREKLKKRTILVHLVATILVVLGIYLIKS
ncbi:EamA family transporter [Candidatus Saccharibacteria bacterium]|nr:EamA family transporter [Candidatus Saccharibacteria bacterium]